MLLPKASWELMAIADVLLMPSRTEGFGLPMAEAQLLGKPAVTTRFSSMGDYTLHGVSVPPLQLGFMHEGLVATPDVAGVSAALRHVAAGGLDGHDSNQSRAADWIREEMSGASVSRQFDALLIKGVAAKRAAAPLTLRASVDADGKASRVVGDDSGVVAAGEVVWRVELGVGLGHDWYIPLRVQDEGAIAALLKRERLAIAARGRRGGQGAFTESAAGALPDWVLVWSSAGVLRMEELAKMKAEGWDRVPAEQIDVLFLETRRSDGTVFPKEVELTKGVLDPNILVLVRTDRFLASAKLLTSQAATTGKSVSVRKSLELALSGKGHLPRKMEIKIKHTVCCDMD